MTEDEEIELVERLYDEWLNKGNPTTPDIQIHSLADWAIENGLATADEYATMLSMPNEFAL